MAWKNNIIGEIYLTAEKLRKKGIAVEINEKKTMMIIKVYYTNIDLQRKIINEFIKFHNIKKRYLKYIDDIYNRYLEVLLFKGIYGKTKEDLLYILEKLKEIDQKFNKKEADDYIRNKVKEEFNYFLRELNRIMDEEKERKRLEDKYLQYLDKKVDFDKEIENFENWLNDEGLQKSSRIRGILRERIKEILKSDNKFTILKIKNGMAFILKYKQRYFADGWNYRFNNYYLVDLRNRNYINVDNIIDTKFAKYIFDEINREDVYKLKDLDILEFLI
jgi:hypothetical protein